MQVVQKIQCHSVTSYADHQEVNLVCTYPTVSKLMGDEPIGTNSSNTSGEITLQITNPQLHGFFNPGASYEITINTEF